MAQVKALTGVFLPSRLDSGILKKTFCAHASSGRKTARGDIVRAPPPLPFPHVCGPRSFRAKKEELRWFERLEHWKWLKPRPILALTGLFVHRSILKKAVCSHASSGRKTTRGDVSRDPPPLPPPRLRGPRSFRAKRQPNPHGEIKSINLDSEIHLARVSKTLQLKKAPKLVHNQFLTRTTILSTRGNTARDADHHSSSAQGPAKGTFELPWPFEDVLPGHSRCPAWTSKRQQQAPFEWPWPSFRMALAIRKLLAAAPHMSRELCFFTWVN